MTSLKQIAAEATNYNQLVAIKQYLEGFHNTWIQDKYLPKDDLIEDITAEELSADFLRVAKLKKEFISTLPKGSDMSNENISK